MKAEGRGQKAELRRVLRAILTSAFCLLPSAFANADTWFTTRAGNFIVFTNTDAARAARTAETLERMRAALALTTNLNTAVPEPIRVYVFKSTKDYQRYGRVLVGSEPEKDGLSFIHPHVKAILLDGTVLRSDALLQHELAHHFARQTWRNLPLWLDEGIAEFYSTLRVRGDLVQIGRSREGHRRVMRRVGIPMRDFLAAGTKSHWYAQPFLENRYYAQSWLLTHWLIINRNADIQSVADAFALSSVDAAITNLFGMHPSQLQRAILRYNQLPALPSKEIRVGALDTATPEEPRVLGADEIESMFVWPTPVPRAVRTIEVPADDPTHLARYDEAVKKVARGELKPALDDLDALIPELPRGDLYDDARKLRSEIAEILRRNRGR